MSFFADTLRFLIQTLGDLFILVLLLRFYLQVARAPFKHPLCQFVVAATNFVVIPMRRFINGVRGYDVATLAVAWLVSLLANVLVLALNPLPYPLSSLENWVVLGLLALLYLFKQSLNLLMVAVIVQTIMSWINPYNPLTPILDALTRPYLRYFSFARIANVDLSPLILLLIIQVILMLPVRMLEMTFLSQLKMTI